MIMLSSLSEYLVLLGSMLLMIGLARLAYGGSYLIEPAGLG